MRSVLSHDMLNCFLSTLPCLPPTLHDCTGTDMVIDASFLYITYIMHVLQAEQ